MNGYFAYIRVSTAKQGTHGVSLIEQKAAIERHAAHNRLEIVRWFEERETAAARGRPVFSQMLQELRRGNARGVVIHKIDRSARNLKDWADLGELIDAGVEVLFAADGLDLNSRGGRLSADIQAVVAADYIRNLREETRKGFYGRLKQGLFPLPAPVGYLNRGGGKEKAVDPKTAPLVRRAFELYGSGNYSLRTLLPEVRAMGLKSLRSGTLSLNGLAKMLANPFYCGPIHIRTTKETFQGVHARIVSVALFECVQRVLKGKAVGKVLRHDWRYRRLLRCAACGYLLSGERQKGRVYYRCHRRTCPPTCVREDAIDACLRDLYARAELTSEEVAAGRDYLAHRSLDKAEQLKQARAALMLQISDAKARMSRLTDALIDGAVDRAAYEERRGALLLQINGLEERLEGETEDQAEEVEKFFELAGSLVLSQEMANSAEMRRLIEITTSNFCASGKKPAITLSEPFLSLANRDSVTNGGQYRDNLRTQRTRQALIHKYIDRMVGETSDSDHRLEWLYQAYAA